MQKKNKIKYYKKERKSLFAVSYITQKKSRRDTGKSSILIFLSIQLTYTIIFIYTLFVYSIIFITH